jgi:outer membrane lipoprotein-sorting protein
VSKFHRWIGSLPLLFLSLAIPLQASAQELAPPPEGLTARSVAERVEEIFRGNTSFIEATMVVQSPRLPQPRRVEFQSWDDRPGKRSFIRILAPPKDKGMSFLKLHPNLWNYIPRVERTVRIPPSMMLQSWMGSDFTNDDLVRESSQIDDYEHNWLGVDEDPPGDESARAFVIEYVPHEDAPVVWGRIVTWVDAELYAPIRQEFYDEDGERLRVLSFGDIQDVGGRPYPHRWSMLPLDKDGHETSVIVSEIRFDEDFGDELFTKRNLRQRE